MKSNPTIEQLQQEVDVISEMYGDLRLEAGQWIELKEGNPLPDFDQYVLWAFEDGTCSWLCLDKDGNDWLYGGKHDGFIFGKATHWRKIMTPAECDEIFNIK